MQKTASGGSIQNGEQHEQHNKHGGSQSEHKEHEEILVKRRKISGGMPPQAGPSSLLKFESPTEFFQSLIHPLPLDQFFQEYWEQKPLVLHRKDDALASYYGSLFPLDELKHLCARGLRYGTDLNLCRCLNGKKKVMNREGAVKYNQLRKDMQGRKATIQFHQPQRFQDELWRIQERLEAYFGALVGSNVYITPGGSQGLPPHYDDVEVLVLQLEGSKHWRLYAPTVPLAREYSLEPEDRIGAPTHDFILQAGDLMYFPRGTIHQADTPSDVDHSTHLTLSTYQNMSWADLLLDVCPGLIFDRIKSDLEIRRGLPRSLLMAPTVSSEVSQQVCVFLRRLADHLEKPEHECKLRSSAMKKDFITHRLPPFQEDIHPEGNAPSLKDTVSIRFKEHLLLTVEPGHENTDEATELVVYVLHSLSNKRETHMMGTDDDPDTPQGLRFPMSFLPALQQLLSSDAIPAEELQLQHTEIHTLLLALWSEGLLRVCPPHTD